MRVITFSPYYPPHRGGLETHSDEFNKYLSEEGAEIIVFTPRLPVDALELETMHHGVTIIRYPSVEIIHNYPIPRFWQKRFWTLWQELKRKNVDIVISRTRFFFPSLMAGYYAWRKNTPWVHIEHGSDFAQFEKNWKSILGKLYDYTLGKLVLKSADTLIANSQASTKFVEYLSGRRDCHTLYRGVEKELILNTSPSTEWRAVYQNKTIVGYIGRLIEGKGVKDLIQAFSEIKRTDCLLVIIGDGPERSTLEEFVVKEKMSNQVLFLGALPLPIAMGYLKVWDIFVNPSYTEGIPTSVIEAALLKKAIIATNVGGTNEIISGTDDGILIPPRDIQALVDALSQLIENSELRKSYGEKAYTQVLDTFLWEKAITKYQTLFIEIIANKRLL